MSVLDRAIAKGVRRGLAANTDTIINVVLDSLWKHPWYPFIAGAQLRLIEAGMAPREAWELARKVLTEFVATEKMTFGDPDYGWGPRDGADLIVELEIDHWESEA